MIILLGFGLGVTLGISGIGAGAILTPTLVVLGIRPAVAVGTSLLFSLFTKPAGALQHLRQGTTDLRMVGWLAAGSVPAAVLSVVLVRTVIPRAALDQFTQRAIATALVTVAVVLTLRLTNLLPRRASAVPGVALAGTGVFIGAMVSLSSVGAGSVTITALGLMTPLSIRALVGTDMVHAALLTAVTAPFFVASGDVDVRLAVALALGSIPGVLLGSRLTLLIPERLIRGIVVALVWAVALKSL